MIITLIRTGGFSGIPLKKTIDTAKLPKEQAQELEMLITNNPINEHTNKQINKPDQFTYALSLQDEDINQQTSFSEDYLTPQLQELIQNLLTS